MKNELNAFSASIRDEVKEEGKEEVTEEVIEEVSEEVIDEAVEEGKEVTEGAVDPINGLVKVLGLHFVELRDMIAGLDPVVVAPKFSVDQVKAVSVYAGEVLKVGSAGLEVLSGAGVSAGVQFDALSGTLVFSFKPVPILDPE